MVRRAASEALCNMASHPDAKANLRSKDKLKIALALAEDYEGDMETARAALGSLATAADDEGERKRSDVQLLGGRGASLWRWAQALRSGRILWWRAGVAEGIVDEEVAGVETLRSLLDCGQIDLVYRATVAVGKPPTPAIQQNGS